LFSCSFSIEAQVPKSTTNHYVLSFCFLGGHRCILNLATSPNTHSTSPTSSVFFSSTFPFSWSEKFRTRACEDRSQLSERPLFYPPQVRWWWWQWQLPLRPPWPRGLRSRRSSSLLRRCVANPSTAVSLFHCLAAASTPHKTSEEAVQGGFDQRLRLACAGPRA
jgi:hypothetical protein